MTEVDWQNLKAKLKDGEIGMTYVNGLLWGGGFMTAVVIFKVLLHISVCG